MDLTSASASDTYEEGFTALSALRFGRSSVQARVSSMRRGLIFIAMPLLASRLAYGQGAGDLQPLPSEESSPLAGNDYGAWNVSKQEKLPTLVFSASDRERERRDLPASNASPIATSHIDRQATAKIAEDSWLPGLFAGIGGVGVGGFLALAAWGRSSELRLQDTCAPRCSDAQVSKLKTNYLVADVSLGIGLVSLATGIYLFMASPAKAGPIQAARIDLRASSSSLSATYAAVF